MLIYHLAGGSHTQTVILSQATEYSELSVRDQALILEALVTLVANTELLRNHLRHLEPEGSTPLLNRGAIMGQDAAGNTYHQLGGQSARLASLTLLPAWWCAFYENLNLLWLKCFMTSQ